MSSAIEEIGQLQEQAKVAQEELDQLQEKRDQLQPELAQVQEECDAKTQEVNSIMAKIRDLANNASGDYQVGDQPTGPNPKTAIKKKPGRPKASAGKKKPGRPKASAGKKKPGRPKASAGKTDNETPLREVVWSVLSRSKKTWYASLPDLPPKVDGLKAVEIASIIEAEGLWASKSKKANVAQQISKHIMDLRAAEKVERGEGARYHIVKGAKLND